MIARKIRTFAVPLLFLSLALLFPARPATAQKNIPQKIYKNWKSGIGLSDSMKHPLWLAFDSIKGKFMLQVLPKYLHPSVPGVHEREEKKYLRLSPDSGRYLSEQQWGLRGNISDAYEPSEGHRLQGTHTVYGFHPFWSGNAYFSYDFGLLSRVGYFSYSVDPETGRSNSPFLAHSWRNSMLQRLAHAKNCKVDLVVTCYGAANTYKLLSSRSAAAAQQTLISNVLQLINMKHEPEGGNRYRGDGVTLDLQGFKKGPNTRKDLMRFLARFRNALNEAPREEMLHLNLILPYADPYDAYEFDSLKQYVDLFIVCGYDYNLTAASGSGPMALLVSDTGGFTIDHSINYYLDKGIPSEQMLLSLPWYGKEVLTETEKQGSANRLYFGEGPVQLRPYSLLHKAYGTPGPLLADKGMNAVSMSIKDQVAWKQVWAEDTITLGLKYDYVRKKKLGGAAIWALGYENGRAEMWKLLRQKFADSIVVDTKTDKPIEKTIAENKAAIDKQRKRIMGLMGDPQSASVNGSSALSDPAPLPLRFPEKPFAALALFCLLVLIVFALVGFLVALRHESVREVVFSKDYLVYILGALIVVGLMLALHLLLPGNKNSIVFVAGALAGSALIAIVLRRMRKKREEGPTP